MEKPLKCSCLAGRPGLDLPFLLCTMCLCSLNLRKIRMIFDIEDFILQFWRHDSEVSRDAYNRGGWLILLDLIEKLRC